MSLGSCGICGKGLEERDAKFCSRDCYTEARRRGIIHNKGQFVKGQVSPNKGRTLESWVGKERAAEIRARMSRNSKKKGDFLRSLNISGDVLRKRKVSRWFHEDVVQRMVDGLRGEGWRGYILSEYIREKRTPDAILFNGKELVPLEVELRKKWKASEESMTSRLADLNGASSFFDRTVTVFPSQGDDLEELIPHLMAKVR